MPERPPETHPKIQTVQGVPYTRTTTACAMAAALRLDTGNYT